MALDNPSTITRKYHEKEEFVTGHSGTTPHEILLLCLVIPIGLHLYYTLHHYASSSNGSSRKHGIIMKICQIDIIIEFITLIVPMLLVQTSLFRPINLLLGMQMVKLLVAFLIPQSTSTSTNNNTSKSPQYNKRPVFLTIHRSCVYILTTIAILAVDFNIFPRSFCKTEVSGYGWMDLGAASFIIIAGWASAFSSSSLSRSNRQTVITSTSALAMKAFMKCAPLLLIGLIRLATNKGLEYQEHVSEYGVHWNFFFTLCFVEGFMVVWKGIKRNLTRTNNNLPVDFILALFMIIPYQIYLSYGGGQEFIVDGERRCSNDSFICNAYVANREGILGVIGYLSLRLLSEDIGRICLLPRLGDGKQSNDKSRVQRRLFVTSSIMWIAHICLTLGLQIPTSRRSTNSSFILWSLAHNMSLLCMIHFVIMRTEEVNESSSGQHTPKILEAVNRFGLAIFLSSNVLTGLVNLTILNSESVRHSDGKAMLILSIYLAAVCGIALLLDKGRNK